MADAVTLAYVCGNEVATSWHHSLIQLLAHDRTTTGLLDRGGYLIMRCGTDGLAEARNGAVKAFLAEDKADWLFWVDTDMGFEPDALNRLFEAADAKQRPMVGALCFAATEDGPDGFGGHLTHPTPTMYGWGHDGDMRGWIPILDFTPGDVVPVAGTGSAAVLIHRSVFERVEAEHGKSWYTRIPNTTTGQLISEDLSFCLKVCALQIPIAVHTGVETTHLKPMWLSSHHYWQARMVQNIAKQLDGQQVEVPA